MTTLDYKVVIPARYGSLRLPGKPLLKIAGKPMIVHVCERALEAEAEQVVVATDDERIFQQVQGLGIDVVMTADSHQSGTERIQEVATKLNWSADQIVVNLQGDEPLIPALYIKKAALALADQQKAGIATLAAKISDVNEVFDSNAVKVVLDHHGYALYFSRAAVPWDRNQFGNQKVDSTLSTNGDYLRHIGLYAYTVAFLNDYVMMAPSAIEQIECLEQLRILYHGRSVFVEVVDSVPEAGVDDADDLQRVEKAILAQE